MFFPVVFPIIILVSRDLCWHCTVVHIAKNGAGVKLKMSEIYLN
jgi:hypothetical protein